MTQTTEREVKRSGVRVGAGAVSALLIAGAGGAERAESPVGEICVTRSGEQASRTGPPQYFTGKVRIDPLFDAKDPSRVSGAYVTFEPGARTVWHAHSLGQHLIVTAGIGRVQRWGNPVQEIRAGDVVWIPPGQKHWHGASPATAMTHIAIQEFAGANSVEWMEPVSNEQYGAPVAPSPSIAASAPALEKYTRDVLLGDLWKRHGLSPRDRSIVTVAALVARGQTIEMPYYFNLALDSGVQPGELSEVIMHLAFYTGWANATAGAAIARDVFATRNIGVDQLPPEPAERLPLDEVAENLRAAHVAKEYGQVAPGLVQYTTDVLFRDLWLRPALAPRDRSLVTVSALVATGQAAQIPFHLNKALDNGLTKTQASEVLTQLAFYVGWPNVFSALPVVKSTLEKRP